MDRPGIDGSYALNARGEIIFVPKDGPRRRPKPVVFNNAVKPPTYAEIAASCCLEFDVDVDKFHDGRRGRTSRARHLCWHILRTVRKWSLPEIAEVSGMDHSSVLYGVVQAQKDPDTEKRVENVLARITAH